MALSRYLMTYSQLSSWAWRERHGIGQRLADHVALDVGGDPDEPLSWLLGNRD
jgi:hypothetical protein